MAINPVSRVTDLCTGHYCFPPRPSLSGSPEVYVNDLAMHRKTDIWEIHCCPDDPDDICHAGQTETGSASVYCNDRNVARVKDWVDCGSVILQGSIEVWVGD
jgi:uncharacterized Zn-binding protein involved in type VI secretion